MKIFEVDKCLGSGAFKRCYEHPEDPTRVLLISQTPLKEEYQSLTALYDLGLPVAMPDAMYDNVKVRVKGDVPSNRHVFVMEKMACGSRGESSANTELPKVLNAKTLDGVRQMREAFDRLKVHVEDLQFLFAPDGRVFISDPQQIRNMSQYDFDEDWYMYELKKIERGVEYANHLRATGRKFSGSSYGFWAESRAWWATNEEPRLRRQAALEGILTVDWKVRPIAA